MTTQVLTILQGRARGLRAVNLSDDDKAFADAMRDVKPLKTPDKVGMERPRPKAEARLSRAASRQVLAESLNGTISDSSGEEVAFRRPGVSERTLRELRRGRYSIEAEVDLHGLNRTEALAALREFIADARTRRFGCVRVVHGKGSRSGPDGPVLKGCVQRWLARWDDVLAVCSANRRHGGNGAVYVLLRRR
jgi:DNA-nicking Smr family endonuclease